MTHCLTEITSKKRLFGSMSPVAMDDDTTTAAASIGSESIDDGSIPLSPTAAATAAPASGTTNHNSNKMDLSSYDGIAMPFLNSLPYDYVFVQDLLDGEDSGHDDGATTTEAGRSIFLFDKDTSLENLLVKNERDGDSGLGTSSKEVSSSSLEAFQELLRETSQTYGRRNIAGNQCNGRTTVAATAKTSKLWMTFMDNNDYHDEHEEELWEIMLFPIMDDDGNKNSTNITNDHPSAAASRLILKKKEKKNVVAMGGLIRILERHQHDGQRQESSHLHSDKIHHDEASIDDLTTSTPTGITAHRHEEAGNVHGLQPQFHGGDLPLTNGEKSELPLDDPTCVTKKENEECACRLKYALETQKALFGHLPIAYTLNEIVMEPSPTTGKPIPVDYITVDINEQFEEMTGLAKDMLLGKRVTEALPGIEKDPANWIERFGRVVLEDTVDHYTQHSALLDRWFSGVAFKYSETMFCVLFSDRQEDVSMKEQIRETEERHLTLFENMKQGVVYHHKDGSTIAANASALRILGLTMDQMLGKKPMDPQWRFVRHDGSQLPIEQYPAVVALSGKPVTGMEFGVYHGVDKKIRWICLDAMPRFRPGETTPYQAYTIFNDVTESKETELELLRAKEKAEEADQLKSAFLACMSHELRTPLHGIIGSLDVILSTDLQLENKDENLECLQTAMNSANLLIAIIQDVLDLSKIEAGQLDIVTHPFSIREVVKSCLGLADCLRVQKMKHDVKLLSEMVDGDSIAERIYGDQYRIQQVLNNLLSNAIKFTDRGSVYLTISRLIDNGVDVIQFSVQDTGKGIPEHRLEMIFEPFRQVEFGDTRKHGGTGLGLTICKKLVEMMGGSLHVESRVSSEDDRTNVGVLSGSKFVVTLPYRTAPVPSKEEEEAIKLDSMRTVGPTRWTTFAYSTFDTNNNISSLTDTSHLSQEKSIISVPSANIKDNPPLAFPSDLPACTVTKQPAHRRTTILIADDDKVSRKIAVRMVRKVHNCEILEASDGLEAIELFQKYREDICFILMDCMMPSVDGLEATLRIREIERAAVSALSPSTKMTKNDCNPAGESNNSSKGVSGGAVMEDSMYNSSSDYNKVPIVALSAGAMKGDREKGLEVGMTDYLYKPVNRKELTATMEKYMSLVG